MEKQFNYFYDGRPITQTRFEDAVPENWQEEVDEFGEYSYGYYRATEIDLLEEENLI